MDSGMSAERDGWYRVERPIRSLTPDECLVPGYYLDPDWTVRDLAAHLGTWLAEAAWWIAKSGTDHYAQHLPRLEEWAAELMSRR